MKRFLKRDLQARGCNPLTPNCPAHSAGPTPLDRFASPFWLPNRCSTFREGSLGPAWLQTRFFYAPWDTPKTARDEKQNHQNESRISIIICHDASLGRSKGTPQAPKKTEHALPDCSMELRGAKTIVFKLMIIDLLAAFEKYVFFEIIKIRR